MKKLYSALILSFISFSLIQAQPSLYNDGAITVEDQGLLYVDGSVEITPDGSMQNDGEVEVKGDWTNDRADGAVTWSASGQRIVKFTGAAQQTITGASGTVEFYNMDATNNTASFVGGLAYSTGGILATADVVVNGTIDLANGDLILLDNDLTIGPDGAITNFGRTDNWLHFNNGALNRRVNAVKEYEYPIHRSGIGYVLGSIDLVTKSSTTDVIRGRFMPQANLGSVFNVGGPCNLPGFPGQSIMLNEMPDDFGYWQFDPYTNTSFVDYTGLDAGWEYDITLHPPEQVLNDFQANKGADYYKILKVPSHDNADNPIPFSTMSGTWSANVAKSGDYCTGIVLINTYDETTGILATNLKDFSGFGGAGNSGGAGLPVELLYLSCGSVDNAYIELEWSTATEVDNEKFEVLRSVNGVDFTTIGEVYSQAPNGNSSQQLTYTFQDYDAEVNVTYYYRLRQVDFDGDTELTYVVSCGLTATDVFVIGEFHPNPTMSGTAIEITSGKEKDMNITIYNTLGQIITARDLDVAVGTNRYEFNLNDLAAGTYHAILTFDNEVVNKKVVVTR